jgi:hypothetical protein
MNTFQLIQSANQHLQNANTAINRTTVPLSKWKTTQYKDITKTEWWKFFNEMKLAEDALEKALENFNPAAGGFALLFGDGKGN